MPIACSITGPATFPRATRLTNPLTVVVDTNKALTAVIAAVIPAIHPPSIQLTTVTAITTVSAILGGAVTDTGGEAPQVTAYWGESDGGTDPLAWAQSANLGIQSGAFEHAISSLFPGTIYHYRCYAKKRRRRRVDISESEFPHGGFLHADRLCDQRHSASDPVR